MFELICQKLMNFEISTMYQSLFYHILEVTKTLKKAHLLYVAVKICNLNRNLVLWLQDFTKN